MYSLKHWQQFFIPDKTCAMSVSNSSKNELFYEFIGFKVTLKVNLTWDVKTSEKFITLIKHGFLWCVIFVNYEWVFEVSLKCLWLDWVLLVKGDPLCGWARMSEFFFITWSPNCVSRKRDKINMTTCFIKDTLLPIALKQYDLGPKTTNIADAIFIFIINCISPPKQDYCIIEIQFYKEMI